MSLTDCIVSGNEQIGHVTKKAGSVSQHTKFIALLSIQTQTHTVAQ